MKKDLLSIKNEKGFYLPFVLVVSIISLSATITSIFIYQNEIEATNLLLQQLEVETMRQVTMERFHMDQMYLEVDTGEFQYELPYSIATGNYYVGDEDVFMEFQIKTDDLTYEFSHQLPINTIN